MKLRGLVHVHSILSYDGRHDVGEIAMHARRSGYAFVAMSEHSDTLTDDTMAAFVEACKRVSSAQCLVIPGIEFTCRDNLHLLGFGVSRYTAERDPAAVARFIRRQGGVAVMAHPVRYAYRLPPDVAVHLHGIEVWNAAYDGRFVPNSETRRLLRRLRGEHGQLLAFGGRDLHAIENACGVHLEVSCEALQAEAVVDAMRRGRFSIANGFVRIDAAREGLWLTCHLLDLLWRLYRGAKHTRDKLALP